MNCQSPHHLSGRTARKRNYMLDCQQHGRIERIGFLHPPADSRLILKLVGAEFLFKVVLFLVDD